MDLLQRITNTSTNFIDLNNVFNDTTNNNNYDNKIQVNAGFYSALGLSAFNLSQPIDFSNIIQKSPMPIRLLNSLQKCHHNYNKCNIYITGHSLGGGLASLFNYVLLAYSYESSISGIYTYGQPLVGNRLYAEILNNKLGNRIHRWVNHNDIVARIPIIELLSIARYYAPTPYSDALGVALNNNQEKFNLFDHHYYHSGLRFRIDYNGNLIRKHLIDQGPIVGYQIDLIYYVLFIHSTI